MVHLSALTNLETLSMAYSLAGDPSMAVVAELTQLQHLDLDSCPITNACVPSSSIDRRMAISYHQEYLCITSSLQLRLIRSMLLPCSRLLRNSVPAGLSDMPDPARVEGPQASVPSCCACASFHTWTP